MFSGDEFGCVCSYEANSDVFSFLHRGSCSWVLAAAVVIAYSADADTVMFSRFAASTIEAV